VIRKVSQLELWSGASQGIIVFVGQRVQMYALFLVSGVMSRTYNDIWKLVIVGIVINKGYSICAFSPTQDSNWRIRRFFHPDKSSAAYTSHGLSMFIAIPQE
jgi:hypothetical protein